MCGGRGFTRATGESECSRQEYKVIKQGENFIGQQKATEGNRRPNVVSLVIDNKFKTVAGLRWLWVHKILIIFSKRHD